jgi:ATP-dependent protease ClpP protease subunit
MKTYGRPPPGFKEHFQDAYTDFWHRRANLPESWLPLPDDKLHILSAEEAQQYGIVDEIVGK